MAYPGGPPAVRAPEVREPHPLDARSQLGPASLRVSRGRPARRQRREPGGIGDGRPARPAAQSDDERDRNRRRCGAAEREPRYQPAHVVAAPLRQLRLDRSGQRGRHRFARRHSGCRERASLSLQEDLKLGRGGDPCLDRLPAVGRKRSVGERAQIGHLPLA